jgi:TPP-dependent indolepyruvate ferredoxin oxidoreductase alpha subunit
LCQIVDDSHHHEGPKLKTVNPNSPEAFYMLAAFCFDLSRKLDYVFLALRRFCEGAHTDKRFARRVLRENEEVYRSRDSWEQAARDTEKVFLRVMREIRNDHQRLLKRMAR